MVGSFICLTQVLDCLFVFIDNDDIIIRVCLLLPTVTVFLLAWIGWSLTLAFGPINNEIVQLACFQCFLQCGTVIRLSPCPAILTGWTRTQSIRVKPMPTVAELKPQVDGTW